MEVGSDSNILGDLRAFLQSKFKLLISRRRILGLQRVRPCKSGERAIIVPFLSVDIAKSNEICVALLLFVQVRILQASKDSFRVTRFTQCKGGIGHPCAHDKIISPKRLRPSKKALCKTELIDR